MSARCRERSVAVSIAGVAGSCACCEVSTISETSGVWDLSWASNVASFSSEFGGESEVTCGGVKEISGIEPSVNNLEPGRIGMWEIWPRTSGDPQGACHWRLVQVKTYR